MTARADFTSQVHFRNPVADIEKLRAAGPVVEVRFPLVGTVWTTTTQDLANQVLKDSQTFTLRKDDGDVVGFLCAKVAAFRDLRASWAASRRPAEVYGLGKRLHAFHERLWLPHRRSEDLRHEKLHGGASGGRA